MVDRAHTDAELDAAIAAISDPKRIRTGQELVMRRAAALQRVLATALEDGGWFDLGHDQAVREAVGHDDPHERSRSVRTMLAEETRLAMLVGVAVGFELAQELGPTQESVPHTGGRAEEPSPTPGPAEEPTPPPGLAEEPTPPPGPAEEATRAPGPAEEPDRPPEEE